ncbi:AraC family transcriptional regulator [Psychrobacter sp. LV10R520-6]|uniref:AraC family transcriptional regulator n=1 Tax=Psychrobacter sp. LV10R520-6 TaxID=1415574 RepID=UPI0024C83D7A|nr:AraC family transcriptional regulator [Psychrobacter sp. LV10R520-6]SNT70039.1 AraC-type DNA-binding protein [Psychrobacter sp. LV10R520-6]
MTAAHTPIFWRDSRMPHIELRKVADGRKVCYDLHSHTHWSLGAITQGVSTFIYRDDSYHVRQGDLVLMNSEWPHACNPIENQPWAYLMLYVDTTWLTQLRYTEGLLQQPRWQDIANAVITDKHLYQGYCTMAATLLDDKRELLDKQTKVVEYLSALMHTLDNQKSVLDKQTPAALNKLASYLNEHCTEELSLDELCTLSGYSPSHLIRSFKQYFGMTPHAYIVNKRIQYGQRELKKGVAIIDTALSAGFADQAHFQRTFKRLVAATPNQYRKPLPE